MRLATGFVSLLLVCLPSAAQHFHHQADPSLTEQFRRSPCDKKYEKPKLEEKWQKVKWVVTGSAKANQYFSQGITQYYGFNFEEAARNFKAALGEDPKMAMAAWGVALASGPNININMQGKCAADAIRYSTDAVELAKQYPVQPYEQGLIDALDARYDPGSVNAVAYAVGLRKVWTTRRKDPNVTALYVESLMDLRPWGLFDNAHRPALDTGEILSALTDVLESDADAIGANHLYIHAVEAGPEPIAALRSAEVLARLVPASGHLVHMPSHINLLIGKYTLAVENNGQAVKVDDLDYADVCKGSFEEYWANVDCPAVYYGHYPGHNYFFRSVAAAFAGQSKEAIASAFKTNQHVQRFVVNEPGLQRYLAAPFVMIAAHQKWGELPKEEPPTECYAQKPFDEPKYITGCHIARAAFHYAHGMAHAAKNELPQAREQLAAMNAQAGEIAAPTPTGWGNNTAAAVLAVPQQILPAKILWAEGKKEQAIEHLKLAVTYEDAMVYDEPPQWFAPAREYLGGAYLQTAQFAQARDTFIVALRQHPKSGRALYGLMRAYEGLGDKPKAEETRKEFEAVWKGVADYEMTVDKLW